MRSYFRILFLTLGGCLVLGQFGRFELLGATAIYFQDILIPMMWVTYLLYRKVNWRQLSSSRLAQLFVALNAWIFATSLMHFWPDFHQLLVVSLYLLRLDNIIALGLVIYLLIREKTLTAREIQTWLVSVVSLIAILGFFQYVAIPDTRGLQLLGWDDHYFRLISTLFDPGFTGIMLVIGIAVVLVEWIRRRNWVNSTLLLTMTVALLLTYSRASYLAYLVMTLLLAWKLKNKIVLFLLPLFLLGMVLLPRPGGEGVKLERTASVVSRIDSVTGSFSQFSLSDGVIGKGWYWKKEQNPTTLLYNAVVPNHSSAAENSYVFLFTSLGVIGVGISLSIVWQLLKVSQGSVEVQAVLLAVGVHALFTNTFFYPFVLIILAVIMARSAQGYREKSRLQQR